MNISFKNIRHLGFGKRQKDPGISITRTTRAWLVLLFGMFFLLGLGALFATYMFYVATNTANVVITNPVDTVHYQNSDIDAALLRYDALRERFSVPVLPIASTTPAPSPAPAAQKSVVATSTPVRVQ
jgi:hypothetical protein